MTSRPTFSGFVVHAPWVEERRAYIIGLQRALYGRVSPFRVVEDVGRRGHWPTLRTGLEWAIRQGTSHVLAFDDDAEVVPGFADAVETIASAHPERIVSLFTMRGKKVEAARERGALFVSSGKFLSDLALLWPTAKLDAFLAWAATHVPRDALAGAGDAVRVLWAATVGEPIYYTAPCLAEHLCPGDSLLGHNNSTRVAPWLAKDARAFDWTDGASISDGYSVDVDDYAASCGLYRGPEGRFHTMEVIGR